MPTPTCQLVISDISADGLPRWQAGTGYYGLSATHYPDMIVDSNGNYQACYQYGISDGTPPAWSTNVGDFTNDGPDLVWRCVAPIDGNFYQLLAYSKASVELGSSFALSWSSTDATSASISGIGSVPTSGSIVVTPDASLCYTGAFDYNHNLSFNVPGGGYGPVDSVGAPYYELTVTGPDGTASSIAMFMLVSPAAVNPISSFAPVIDAAGSDFGGTGGATGTSPTNLPVWAPNTNYTTGSQVQDSSGNGQVALNNQASGSTPPTWAALGNITTEITGLQWHNTGPAYKSELRQTGFGALWNRPSSFVTHGFDAMVMPACISAVTPYAVNTPYVIGDIVSMYFFGGYLDNSGIIFFECFYPGTTGPNDPTTTPAYSMNIMRGEIIPDASFNPGGEPAWKVLGSLQITLNGQGTQILASGGYPAVPQILGPLSSIFEFDGTVNSRLLENYSDVSSFISDPASWNITYQSINTANPAAYTAIDVPVECPIWTSIALATAYINCGDGYNLLAAGVWATFLMPYTLPPPAPRGTITLLKQTAPAGSVESFTITPSWKDPVTLTDGQSDTSDVAAGTYSATETIPAGWFLSTNIDPSAIVVGEGDHITLIFLNSLVPPIPARVLPYLKIPSGQGQSVQELDGQSSISTLDIECIDPSNELKLLANKPSLVGRMAYFKMGFENMKLSDFVPLHTVQIADVGRTPEGWVRFSCRDNLALLDRALWYCGGPQPVALPWLYGQRYEAGQYVQDSNGNIQQCIVAGITSRTQPPTWPGTIAPVWQPNTSYTLGYWAIDNVQGNLQQVTTVPAGSSPTRPLNTGVSGDGFPNPSWSAVVGGITTDNSGGNPNGPLSWTCIAINNVLGEQVTDGTVTWQLVAFPYRGAFGGSQAFYVYNLFGQTVQVPEPPPRTAFTSNQFPTVDGNPRYIYGNPLDALLVALQNELGLGQNPLLPPIVTTDPNDPQNALVFAPNPAWQQYTPGDDSTLINPNPFVRIANVLSLRDNEVSGRKFEWIIKRPVTAKSWIQEEILKPLGLYMYTHADGSIDLKSMKSPASTTPFVIDDNTTKGTPDQTRIPVVNVVTTRGDVDDLGAYSAARVYDAEMTFVQKESLAIYKQEFANSLESNGMREAYDSYGVGFLLADRIFRRHGFATPQYDLKVFLGAVRLELGDYILLSNKLMLDYKSTTGRVGLFRVLCEIVDRQPDYANAAISLKVLDTRFMQETTPYLIAPLASAIPDWPTATTAQRKKYMFIAYWPGWMSDGTNGNELY